MKCMVDILQKYTTVFFNVMYNRFTTPLEDTEDTGLMFAEKSTISLVELFAYDGFMTSPL